MKKEKRLRLEKVARLYYEEGLSQAEIAGRMKVSRPLISRMLHEAREWGIVEIRIHSQAPESEELLAKASAFGLKGGVFIQKAEDDNITNRLIGESVLKLIDQLGGGRIGLGWGHVIGMIVSILEERTPENSSITDVSPMAGNSGISIRHYHSNENVRIFAQQTMAQGHYLYTPALAETRQELERLLQTQQYRSIMQEWKALDIALVNIGVHPSTPDFATSARFGKLLTERHAVGRMIAYFFNEEGEIIFSDQDYSIQIPLDTLVGARHVIGICSANVTPAALRGALRTRMFTHIAAPEDLMKEAVEK